VSPYAPIFGDIIITEIMCNPNEEQAEYFELYNASNETILLAGLKFKDGLSEAIITSGELLPKAYLIMTANGDLYPDINKGQLSKWLTLNNGGETLAIYNKDELIFSTTYSEDWYKSTDKKTGGYSIEMVDVTNFCGEMGNWSGSQLVGGPQESSIL